MPGFAENQVEYTLSEDGKKVVSVGKVLDEQVNTVLGYHNTTLTTDHVIVGLRAYDNYVEMAQDSEDEEDLQEDSEEDDIDLSAIADDSIDDNFEEIINTKNQQAAPTIAVDKDTKINADILETNTQKENLPIFKEEEPKDNNVVFSVGNIIVHKKYGKGTDRALRRTLTPSRLCVLSRRRDAKRI